MNKRNILLEPNKKLSSRKFITENYNNKNIEKILDIDQDMIDDDNIQWKVRPNKNNSLGDSTSNSSEKMIKINEENLLNDKNDITSNKDKISTLKILKFKIIILEKINSKKLLK